MLLFSTPALSTCWNLAEYTYGIDANLLKAIAHAESGMNSAAMNRNTNGTYDIGLMQINSTHLPRLKGIGVTEEMLIVNPCISLLTGASILNGMIRQYGYGWEAVGAYNAGTSSKRVKLRKKYATKIARIYRNSNGYYPW